MKYICGYCKKQTDKLCYCFFDEIIYDDDGKII